MIRTEKETRLLTTFPINGFVRITDPERARRFYEETLGLAFDYENPYVMVFRRGNSQIIAQKMKDFTSIPATVLGWEVEDIEKVVSTLRERDVTFEKFEGMEQ